jgi:hypothetical protein
LLNFLVHGTFGTFRPYFGKKKPEETCLKIYIDPDPVKNCPDPQHWWERRKIVHRGTGQGA